MNTWKLATTAIALAAFAIVGCGGDSSPTGGSSTPAPLSAAPIDFNTSAASNTAGPIASSSAADVATRVTTVAEILANPEGLFGSTVTLVGQLVRGTNESDEFIFSDGTGEIRVDFQSDDIAPLNTPISITATVASSELDVISWSTPGRFSCDEVQEVRARFSKPGFAIGPVIGLFLEYVGAPAGNKIVEITWDEKNNPGEVERLNVGEGNGQQNGVKFDLIGLIAWLYDDLEGTEEKQIRVSLRIEGRDGQCSRVRRVTVTPGPSLDVGPRGGGTRGESGLSLSATITTPSGSRARYTASASVKNVSSEPIEGPVRVAFVTPPGYGVVSTCRSGSEGGGLVICNVGLSRESALFPGRESERASVTYESGDIGGIPSPGAIAVMHAGLLGEVFDYIVDPGSTLGVTNLRELAR